MVTPGIIPNRNAVAPWVSGLEGEMLLSTGKRKEGRELLIDVQKRLRAIPGPDAWIQTLFRLETIARTARTAGDWELAEHTARQMIDHDAAYGGSHHALGLVLRHNGDVPGAAAAFETARRLWGDADEDLPELREMKEDLADAAATPDRP